MANLGLVTASDIMPSGGKNVPEKENPAAAELG
jgi:hypothetical protein